MINVIIGRLGKDAEVSETSNGSQCVKFTVAENDYKGGENKTIWYDVTSYDSFVAKSQIKVLKKGAFVVIVGDVDCRINVGKNGKIYLNYNVIASTIKVPNLGGDRKNNESEDSTDENTVTTITTGSFKVDESPVSSEAKRPTPPEPAYATVPDGTDEGDDLPF